MQKINVAHICSKSGYFVNTKKIFEIRYEGLEMIYVRFFLKANKGIQFIKLFQSSVTLSIVLLSSILISMLVPLIRDGAWKNHTCDIM